MSEASVRDVTIAISITDQFPRKGYYRTCYIKLGDLASGRRPKLYEIHVILVETRAVVYFYWHVVTWSDEEERNARRATVRDASFIYNRGGVRARCAASAPRDARVEYYARLLRLSSLACVSQRLIEEVLHDREAAERQTVAKPLSFILSEDWLNLRLKSKNEIRVGSRRYILFSSRVSKKNELIDERSAWPQL